MLFYVSVSFAKVSLAENIVFVQGVQKSVGFIYLFLIKKTASIMKAEEILTLQ